MDLFGSLDLPKSNEPLERKEITTTILYLEKEELKQFKELTKSGMKKMYQDTYKDENFADFLLTVLKEYNDKNS